VNDEQKAYAATPSADLERQIMDSSVPKNERERWASHEIHRLRDIIDGGCPMHPVGGIGRAKKKFLSVCAEWADALIGDAVRTKEYGYTIKFKPEDVIPKVVYGEPEAEASMATELLAIIREMNGTLSNSTLPAEIRVGMVRTLVNQTVERYRSDVIMKGIRIDELPDVQRKVWLAGWQLMVDAWDATPTSAPEISP